MTAHETQAPIEQPRLNQWRHRSIVVRRFLGKGRSGACWLIEEHPGQPVVLKEMHDEPRGQGCPATKLADEIRAHRRLGSLGIPTPVLYDYDVTGHALLKEYIDGEVASVAIADGRLPEAVIPALFAMAAIATDHGWNLDYHPSNFIIRGDELFYIDYELEPWAEEHSLRNRGIFLWANPLAMRRYLATGDDAASPLDSRVTSISDVRAITDRVHRWLQTHDPSEALFPG